MTTSITLNSLVLKRGAHNSPEEGLDVMEAVAMYAGEPHSDYPRTASRVIAAGMRSWNDELSDESRQMLKPYITPLIGTAANIEVELTRSWIAFDELVRTHAPLWLHYAGATEIANQLAGSNEITDTTSADAVAPLLFAALQQANALWAKAGGVDFRKARGAIGAAGSVSLWVSTWASRTAKSEAIDAARAASGEAASAATAAGADINAIVAGLQASTHKTFASMISLTGGSRKM